MSRPKKIKAQRQSLLLGRFPATAGLELKDISTALAAKICWHKFFKHPIKSLAKSIRTNFAAKSSTQWSTLQAREPTTPVPPTPVTLHLGAPTGANEATDNRHRPGLRGRERPPGSATRVGNVRTRSPRKAGRTAPSKAPLGEGAPAWPWTGPQGGMQSPPPAPRGRPASNEGRDLRRGKGASGTNRTSGGWGGWLLRGFLKHPGEGGGQPPTSKPLLPSSDPSPPGSGRALGGWGSVVLRQSQL